MQHLKPGEMFSDEIPEDKGTFARVYIRTEAPLDDQEVGSLVYRLEYKGKSQLAKPILDPTLPPGMRRR